LTTILLENEDDVKEQDKLASKDAAVPVNTVI